MKNTAIASLLGLAVADLTTLEQWVKVAALLAPIVVGVIQALRRPPRREPRKPRKPVVRASTLPLLAVFVALALCAGCAKDRVSSIVTALGRDTNAVSVKVVSPWGTVDVRRNASAVQ